MADRLDKIGKNLPIIKALSKQSTSKWPEYIKKLLLLGSECWYLILWGHFDPSSFLLLVGSLWKLTSLFSERFVQLIALQLDNIIRYWFSKNCI